MCYNPLLYWDLALAGSTPLTTNNYIIERTSNKEYHPSYNHATYASSVCSGGTNNGAQTNDRNTESNLWKRADNTLVYKH